MSPHFNFRCICYILLFLSFISSSLLLYWSYFSDTCNLHPNNIQIPLDKTKQNLNLLTFPSSWNLLNFPSQPPLKLLKIALFVKKWPTKHHAGGLERHASTLHIALAERGHEVHVFTATTNLTTSTKNLHFHLSKPTNGGYLDQATIWNQYLHENSSGKPFDVIHTESVSLMHTRSRNLTNLAVSWHGIAYESIHSDIIQDILKEDSKVGSTSYLTRGLSKVIEEIKFFPRYAHHVATSDHVGDVLKRIYMLPQERVHIILNGVDEAIFKPESSNGRDLKLRFGIKQPEPLVLGMAGRLVKDKGHPLIFEALRRIFNENSAFRESVIVLVAGDGPWGARYKDLGSNVRVLGPLDQDQLAGFYNVIDVFVNPTLRAQGLDHTLLEAMLVGKPLMATKLASITGSVIVSEDVGYTFPPTVEELKKALYEIWRDGKVVLKEKGEMGRKRALQLFTAAKMAGAYERLFLCIARNKQGNQDYCTYNFN